MDSLCRLCLSPNSGTTPLFDHRTLEPNLLLLQKILECTSVKLTIADDFPSSVCAVCEEKLNELSTFKIQCIVNNDYYRKKQAELRKHLIRNQQPTEIVCIDDDDDDEQYEPPVKKQVEPPSKKAKVDEQVIIDDDEDEEEEDEEQESLAAINGQMPPMYYDHDGQEVEDDDYELELVEGQEYQDQWQPEQNQYGGYPEMDNNAILSSILLDDEDEESRSSLMAEVKYEHYENRGDEFGCNFCGRRYSTELKLKTHEKLHSEGLKKCFICGKMIVLHLLRHMRSQHQGMLFPEPVRCWHTKCAGLKEAFYGVDQLLEHMDSKRTRK